MYINREHRSTFSGKIMWGIKVDLPGVKSFDEELYRYEELEKTKILLEGYRGGRRFFIGKNRFCEPVAYVEMLKTDEYYGLDCGNDYTGKPYWLPKEEQEDSWYTGFDHGHAGDYCPYNAVKYGDDSGYKWPLTEMLMEISELICEIERDNEISEENN